MKRVFVILLICVLVCGKPRSKLKAKSDENEMKEDKVSEPKLQSSGRENQDLKDLEEEEVEDTKEKDATKENRVKEGGTQQEEEEEKSLSAEESEESYGSSAKEAKVARAEEQEEREKGETREKKETDRDLESSEKQVRMAREPKNFVHKQANFHGRRRRMNLDVPNSLGDGAEMVKKVDHERELQRSKREAEHADGLDGSPNDELNGARFEEE